MNIFISGMYRSGSTFTYNLVKGLKGRHEKTEWNIHKVHHDWLHKPKGPSDLSIYTYRDIRDVIVSFCQLYSFSFSTFSVHGRSAIPFMHWAIDFHNEIMSQHNPNILILRYEDCVMGNPMETYDIISDFLSVPRDHNKDLQPTLDLTLQKKATDQQKGLDQSTLYWPNHINDGAHEKYQNFFSPSELDLIHNDSKIQNYLKTYEY